MASKPNKAKAKSGDGKRERRFITPVFRLSYPFLFEARNNSDDPKAKPKYSCAAIWTPSKFSESERLKWKKILHAMNVESQKAFGKDWKNLPSHFRKGIRNGDEKEGQEGYGPNTRFANLASLLPPGVIDKNGETIHPDEGNADEIYAGCYCRATITVFAFDKGGGKGISIGLRNIQKVKNGPRLDNRVAAKDDFDDEIESQWLDEDDDIDTDDDNDFGDDDDDNDFD